MRALLAAVSAATVATFFVVMRAETPWFAPKAQELFSVAASTASINPGQEIVLASVPANRRLVLTSGFVLDPGRGLELKIEVNQRDSSGVSITKFPKGMFYGLTLVGSNGVLHGAGEGPVFEPGTDAVLRLDSSAGQGTTDLNYYFGGY